MFSSNQVINNLRDKNKELENKLEAIKAIIMDESMWYWSRQIIQIREILGIKK